MLPKFSQRLIPVDQQLPTKMIDVALYHPQTHNGNMQVLALVDPPVINQLINLYSFQEHTNGLS
jgi:hypothetical protein